MSASVCVRCGTAVDPSRALFSSAGIVCESCNAQSNVAELETKGRRSKWPWLIGAIVIASAGAVAAWRLIASPDYAALALAAVERDGLRDIVLTPSGDRKGTFSYRARDSDGRLCEGSVAVSGSESSSSTTLTRSCRLDESKCTPADAKACAALADEHAKDPVKRASFLERACEGGHGPSCTDAGVLYAHAEGVQKDEARAVSFFQKACAAGSAQGCRNLGICAATAAGMPKDDDAALTAHDKACELNNYESCHNAAVGYADGVGTKRDLKKAAALFEKACSNKVEKTCGKLGYVLAASGEGAELERGQKLLDEACGHDEAQACANLALIIANGKLKGDDDGSRRAGLFQKACKLDYALACSEFGVMVGNGRGGQRTDVAEAVRLFEKSCSLGAALGCFNLGIYVKNGRGVPRDVERARAAFGKACDGGEQDACKERDKLPKP